MWTVWFLLHLRHFFRINPRTCMHTGKKYLGLKYSSTMKHTNGMECLGSISKHVSLMLDRPYWVSCFMTIVINFRRFTTSSFNKWSVKIWWLWSNTNALRFSFVFYNNLKKRTTNKHTHLLYAKLRSSLQHSWLGMSLNYSRFIYQFVLSEVYF